MVAIPRRALAWAHRTVLAAATLMAVSSYFAYTTAGFDFEVDNGEGVDAYYYRLRWDDGSTWVGLAVQPCARPDHPLDWFDPGGSILEHPRHPVHPRWWNALGFWRVTTPADDPYVPTCYIGAKTSLWWACPSWLALLALWGRPIWRVAMGEPGRGLPGRLPTTAVFRRPTRLDSRTALPPRLGIAPGV